MTATITIEPYDLSMGLYSIRQYPGFFPGYFVSQQPYVYNPTLHPGHITVHYPYGFVLPGPILGGFGIGHGFSRSFAGHRM